jgi:hypothetical protein
MKGADGALRFFLMLFLIVMWAQQRISRRCLSAADSMSHS